MNKIVIWVIIAVVVIGGGWYFMQSNPNQASNDLDLVTTENQDGEKMTNSLAQLLSLGKNMTCNFSRQDENGQQEGTVYIASNKMRGNYKMTSAEGQSFDMYVIQDGEWAYTWGGPLGVNQGTKIKITDVADETAENTKDIDFNQEIDFDCDSWKVDNDQFTPPSNVNFQDLSVQMMQIEETTNQLQNSQCAVCDQVPGAEAQEQCRQALGC